MRVDEGEVVEESLNKKNMVSINAICSALHMVALLNYRKGAHFVTYVTDIIKLIGEAGKLSSCLNHKHYSRVIWALCVLAPKKEIVGAYILVEEYFKTISDHKLSDDMHGNSTKVHDILNFYYCFLILKTYYPQINSYFPLIEKSLNDNKK